MLFDFFCLLFSLLFLTELKVQIHQPFPGPHIVRIKLQQFLIDLNRIHVSVSHLIERSQIKQGGFQCFVESQCLKEGLFSLRITTCL
ncbi:hypothetical protein ES703_87804 [subsurface metagenome]